MSTIKNPSGATETKYLTRYGFKTAKESVEDLLDRSWIRIRFLQDVFNVAQRDGEGITMSGYSSCGLAAFLQDIAYDVGEIESYFIGSEKEPGKIDDAPEGSHE